MEVTIRGIRFMVTTISPTPYDLSYPLVWVLFAIEFLALCYSFVYIPSLLRVLEKTPLFQKNLVRITQASLVIFYPNLLARVILIIYEVGILRRQGCMLSSIVVLTAGFIRIWYANSALLYLPSAIIERGFASKYITDYERISRPWIYKVIITGTHVASLLCSVTTILGTFNVIPLAAFTATFLLSCCLAYIILFRRDSAKLRAINKDIQPEAVQYTLSTKFQLTENLRVMKILMYLSIVLAATAVACCLLFALSAKVLIAYPYWSQVCYSLANVFIALWFDVTITVFMVVLDMVHLRSLPFQRFKIKTVLKSRTINDHRGASNAYFDQLTRSWRM